MYYINSQKVRMVHFPRVLLCTRHEANGAFFSTHVKAGHVTHGNKNSPFSIGKF
jgi:hypothetical protein